MGSGFAAFFLKDQGRIFMLHRKAVRWFVALVLVSCGAVFGLPDLGRAQLGGPAGTGNPSRVVWDPASLAPPPGAVATRDLPLVDEGPQGGAGAHFQIGPGPSQDLGRAGGRCPLADPGPGRVERDPDGGQGQGPAEFLDQVGG